MEDLEHFVNAKHAAEAFDMLDEDKDGQASLKDVRAAVCTIFRCCCCLQTSRLLVCLARMRSKRIASMDLMPLVGVHLQHCT